nr:hypothetical protein [Tanacetum cinerariifolium]
MNHITHLHCEVIKAQKNQNPEAGQTSMVRDGSVFRYDPDYLHEQFTGLVIQRALPFNHFDHEQTTRVFQNTMKPRYTHVSRSTLKRDTMKLWLAAKQEIINSFGNLNAFVNLTTDVWSAPHGVPGFYMCIAAHWIEPGTWQMMKRVISFEEFPSPHTGHALFKMLIKVLTIFNLEDKVMLITLENASNNTSVMDKLKLKYDSPMRALSDCELEGGILSSMIKPMKKKLRKYFQHMPPKITCAAALNSCFNVNGVDFLIESISSDLEFFDDDFASKSKSYFKESLEASESVFSTSGRVLLIRRTRLTPTSLEMCMCLKDHLDAKVRKQDKCPLEIPLDFEEDVFDNEAQRNKNIPLSDEEIASNSSSEGTLSPGGPLYDYMMSSEAEDDY